MQFVKKLPVLLLTLVLLVQLFAGCSKRDDSLESTPSSESPTSQTTPKPTEKPTEPKGEPVSDITPKLTEDVVKFHDETNSDTVGWLQVPGTPIDYGVVLRADDPSNNYYYRLGYDGQYSFNGVLWADYSTEIGDGSREQLGVNTCIYGHAMTDVPEKDTYDIRFGPLHDFRDEDFANQHPYINFSTAKEDMIFEVIAVFVANADNPGLPYNQNSDNAAEFVDMVKNEILPRSKYDYNVELNEDDKFITLSACIYTLDNGTVTNYPNTQYRYAIMGRLVDPDEPFKEDAGLKLNPNVLIDPDGDWPNA